MLGNAKQNKEAEKSNADKETTSKSADTNFTAVKNDIDAVKLKKLPSFLQTDCTKEVHLHVIDRISNMNFLIDTGSAVSIIPLTAITIKRNLVPDDLKLFAANNSLIKTYGTKKLSINLGLRRNFNWNFIIADVKCPILGADYLAKYGLIPDIKSKRLLDPLTTLSSSGAVETTSIRSVYTLDPKSKFFTIVNKYIDLCSANNYSLPDASVVCHQIVTDGQPVH
ncbi:uncharacterized protein LOC119665691 [Teleopsis dalmanni]|uniref:uncharacterized protein LOC119665646 n=1 Tax=Teleopsis dalmanni TaxID=139649 RepID=UPI0018CF8F52|nr:uncharacterized protein LOC119665646 [Teleopsis dalmanni]XP_037930851.1 uncharacterized protein LOC119665691 [Teleopsis dalmanni]